MSSFMATEVAATKDQFPIGMRVLAVDDDPVCLKLLEALLRRCRYHVTTTNQAITALKLLRENKERFDLVISDVHMPDMDGFKLLELVGLEMDLPVIMLSVNGETKTVMKGISHGACDYLLKPVRIEELRNIWQHVLRRRKSEYRDHCNNRDDSEKALNANCESRQGPHINGLSDQNGNFSRKRKDQDEEDVDECEENVNENDDPSTQKKPRVVWSIELHRKFVAAVNQLGIDKAVPKRILELMNVEKLTRENVASHLQKYRLYLKRLSAVASQQANMVAAFGASDPSYLHIGPLDGFGNFHMLSASGRLTALPSFQPTGVLNRTESVGSEYHGLASSGIVQFGRAQNHTSLPMTSKLPQIDLTAVQQGSLLQGVPTSLQIEQLQPKRMQEAKSLAGGFSCGGFPIGSSSSSFAETTNTPLIMQARNQQAHSEFDDHSSMRIPSMCSDRFQVTSGVSSNLPNLGRFNDTWQDPAQLTGYVSDALSMGSSINHDDLRNLAADIMTSQIENDTLNNPCSSVLLAPQVDPLIGIDVVCQANALNRGKMLLPATTDGELKNLNFSNAANSKPKLEEPKQNHMHEHEFRNNSFQSSASSSNFLKDPLPRNQGMNSNYDNRDLLRSMITNKNVCSSILVQNSNVDGLLKQKDDYILENSKLKGGLVSNGCIFDDLVGSVINPERDDTVFMDNEFGCDFYTLGACM